MKVLGIHSYSHDTSAVLVEDGKIRHAVEEERFVNIKHVRGFANGINPPINAINWILSSNNLKLDDIDIFAHTSIPLRKSVNQLNLVEYRFMNFAEELDPGLKRTMFFDHHLCHAVSAFLPSGFDKANIMTTDGRGTSQATGLYYADENALDTILEIPFSHSLGGLYKKITRLLGFGRWGEGKTMALASLGKPLLEFENLVEVTTHGYKIDEKLSDKLIKHSRNENEPIKQVHCDIAATIQQCLEKALVHLAVLLFNETHEKRFALAGGVALNCTANRKLLELDFTEDIFIQPASHDAGTAIGAALEASRINGFRDANPLQTIYMGPQFSDREIEDFLIECGVDYQKAEEQLCKETVDLLLDGNVIGWFQGAMEFGPRALGNRSILANPHYRGIHDRVNEIKHREKWRPLAPAILHDASLKLLSPAVKSPYMTLAFRITDQGKEMLAPVAHSDGTVRAQTLDESDNKLFHGLVSEFDKVTGIPYLINTSFNDKGMPIVRTPRDAIRTFFSTGLDYLVIGSYIVGKNRKSH